MIRLCNIIEIKPKTKITHFEDGCGMRQYRLTNISMWDIKKNYPVKWHSKRRTKKGREPGKLRTARRAIYLRGHIVLSFVGGWAN